MLNPIEKFKSSILDLNRDWNHCIYKLMIDCKLCVSILYPWTNALPTVQVSFLLLIQQLLTSLSNIAQQRGGCTYSSDSNPYSGVELLNFSMGFNIIALYMEMLQSVVRNLQGGLIFQVSLTSLGSNCYYGNAFTYRVY